MVAALAWALPLAVSANAETVNATGVPATPPAAEIPTDVQEVSSTPKVSSTPQVSSTPVEQPQTTETTSEASVPAEPAEVEGVASVDTDVNTSGGPSPVPQVDVPQVDVPQAKDVASVVPSPSDAARSAGVGTGVDVPSDDVSNTIVGGVVEEARKDAASEQHITQLVAEARRGSAGTIAAATEYLAAGREELARLPVPLAPSPSVKAEAQPSAGTQAGEGTTSDRPAVPSMLQEHAGLLPSPEAIDLRLTTRGVHPADAGILETDPVRGSALDHWKLGLSSRTVVFETAFGGARHERFDRPAPSHLPPPAPHAPTTGVPDGGGTSFVPIAALLALLALVAPAALRRLGRAVDFHPPIPFVCALERPG